MKGLRYSPLHVTEFCGEMQGKFKVGLARLIIKRELIESKGVGNTSRQLTTADESPRLVGDCLVSVY